MVPSTPQSVNGQKLTSDHTKKLLTLEETSTAHLVGSTLQPSPSYEVHHLDALHVLNYGYWREKVRHGSGIKSRSITYNMKLST